MYNECLEHIEGVPKVIVCDNMKTTMDKAQTIKTPGVINKDHPWKGVVFSSGITLCY